MQALVTSCLAGDPESRNQLESLLTDSNFWPIALPALQSFQDPLHLNLTLILIHRRLNVSSIDGVDVNELIHQLLLLMDRCMGYMAAVRALSKCLSHITVLMSDMRAVIEHILRESSNYPLFSLCFLSDVGVMAADHPDVSKKDLSGLGNEVVNFSLQYIGEPDISDEVFSAAILCLQSWIGARLLTEDSLFGTGALDIVLRRAVLRCHHDMIASALAELCDDLLTAAVDDMKKSNDVPVINQFANSPSIILLTHKAVESISTSLITAIADSTAEMKRVVGGLEFSQTTHSCVRVLAASLKLVLSVSPNPFRSFCEQHTRPADTPVMRVLELLCDAASSRHIAIAVVAMEAICCAQARMPTEPKHSIKDQGIFREIAKACLHHCCRTLSCDFDESVIDSEEWLMHREQVVCETFRSCYVEMRAEALQLAVEGINRLLGAGSGDIDRDASVLSGYLRAVRSACIDLSKRSQLVGVSESALFNASKAGRSAESPTAIREDAERTCTLLVGLLQGLMRERKSHQAIGHHETVSECVTLTGSLAAWINRGKYPKSSPESPQTGEVFSHLSDDVLDYILAGLSTPHTFPASASALRSFCSHCGKRIATNAAYVDAILDMWRGLCSSDQRNLRMHISSAQTSVGEWGNSYREEDADVLLEVQKCIVQAISMVLKHAPSEVIYQYASVLMQPVLDIIARGMTTTETDRSAVEMDMIAMTTLFTMFIRSIRVPLPSSSDKDSGVASYKHVHPALELMDSCGHSLLQRMLQLYPTSAVAESVCFLCTSMITFVSPLLRPVELPSFCVLLYNSHVQIASQYNPASACEFACELLEVVGGTYHYQHVKALFQSSFGEEYSPEVMQGLEDILVRVVQGVCFPCLSAFEEVSRMPESIARSEWITSRQAILSCPLDSFELTFSVICKVLDNVRSMVHRLPWLEAALRTALMLMADVYGRSSLSLSACRCLQSLITSRSKAEESRKMFADPAISAPRFAEWEVFIIHAAVNLRQVIATECLVQLASEDRTTVSEVMTETYAGLLHICLVDMKVSSGSERISADEVAHVARCRNVSSIPPVELSRALNIIDRLVSPVREGEAHMLVMSSEMLDFCKSIADVVSGKSSLNTLVEYQLPN